MPPCRSGIDQRIDVPIILHVEQRDVIMMKLDNAIQKAIRDIPECVAAGFVDMSTGMLLGVKTIDTHPREVLDLVAAATADLFQGSTVTAIEKLFRKTRGCVASPKPGL